MTSEYLKKELWGNHSYILDYNNSYNYIPKLSLELNYNKNNDSNNGERNSISKNNESLQNNNTIIHDAIQKKNYREIEKFFQIIDNE